MSKKRFPVLKMAAITGTALTVIECVNRLLFRLAAKNAETPDENHLHEWKNGKFYYDKKNSQEKEGENHPPILIIHDLYPDQSSENCLELADQLSKNRTVYLMDLLGCGYSDKPAITYINYLYVLQIKEMIEQVIQKPVHLVAYGKSASIAVAAVHNQPQNMTQLTLIDPDRKIEMEIPDRKSKLAKKLIEMPVIGTLLYHIEFKMNQRAHLGGPNARYLFASILGRHTNWSTEWMLQNIKAPIHVIRTDEM